MQIQKIRPTVFQLKLHALELATLISAARWVTNGAKGELSLEAIKQLQKVISDYDTQQQPASQRGIGRLENPYLPSL